MSDIYKDCKLDPFKSYKESELSEILDGCIKNFTTLSQDSQSSDLIRDSYREKIKTVQSMKTDKSQRDDLCKKAKQSFSSDYSNVLRKRMVVRSDGKKVVSKNVAIEALRNTGWNVEFNEKIIPTGYSLYDPPAITGQFQFDQILRKLDRLGFGKLDDWLNYLIGSECLHVDAKNLKSDIDYRSVVTAFEAVQSRFNANAGRNLSNRQNHNELIGLVNANILGNEAAHHSFIMYSHMKPVCESINNAKGMIHPDEIKRMIKGITICGTLSEAEKYIEDYYISNGFYGDFSLGNKKILSCKYCGIILEDDGNLNNCTNCGGALFVSCPKCANRCLASESACGKCGFLIYKSMDIAVELESDVLESLDKGDLRAARKNIEGIRNIYPKSAKLPELSERLHECEDVFNRFDKDLDVLLKNNQLRSLLNNCKKLLEASPKCSRIIEYHNDAKQKMDRVEAILSSVDSKDKIAEFDAYSKASDICADDPRIIAYMAAHPPEPPMRIDVAVKNDRANVSITPSKQGGAVTFHIVRNEGMPPSSSKDGTILLENKRLAFIDDDVATGREYYYAVYSVRSGKMSETAAISPPVRILPNVSDVSLQSIPNSLILTFSVPKGSTKIHVWKNEGGPKPCGCGKRIPVSVINDKVSYQDTDVAPNSAYYYSIYVEYPAGQSSGITVNETLIEYPDPINLAFEHDGLRYFVSWKEESDCDLYYSDNKTEFKSKIVPSDDIKRKMKPIDVEKGKSRHSLVFDITDEQIGFVYPVIQKGQYAVVGKCIPVCSYKPLSNFKYVVEKRECTLAFDIPANSKEIRILWNSGHYPKSIDEPKNESLSVNAKTFKASGNILKMTIPSNRVYMSIYIVYSDGVISDAYRHTIVLRKPTILYSITVSKPILSKKSVVKVSFRTEDDHSHVPGVSVVLGDNNYPRTIYDGKTIKKIESVQFEDDVAEVKFDIPYSIEASMVRLFFTKAEDNDLSALIMQR